MSNELVIAIAIGILCFSFFYVVRTAQNSGPSTETRLTILETEMAILLQERAEKQR